MHRRNLSTGSIQSGGSFTMNNMEGFGTDSADDRSWQPSTWGRRGGTVAGRGKPPATMHRRSRSGVSTRTAPSTADDEDDSWRTFPSMSSEQHQTFPLATTTTLAEQKFELAGVIVHSGTFRSGHYYTLMKLNPTALTAASVGSCSDNVPAPSTVDPIGVFNSESGARAAAACMDNVTSPPAASAPPTSSNSLPTPFGSPAAAAAAGGGAMAARWVMFDDDKVKPIPEDLSLIHI